MYQLYHGDCIEVMKTMQSESVDLVLTDPPYGIDFSTNYRKANKILTQDGIANDKDNIEFLTKAIEQCHRLLKNDRHFYWFTRWDKIPEQLPVIQHYFNVKNILVWVKNNWSMGDLGGAYAGQYECIIFGHKGVRKLNAVDGKDRHPDVLNTPRVNNITMYHNHQKPLPLLKFLILKSSNKGDVVLDPFTGSGSTLLAAEEVDRNSIGIEINEKYYQVIKNRLEEAQSQISLFS